MTIYDWVTRLDFLRGEPAALLVLATAVFILLIPDKRLAILGLAVQYFAVALLYVDILDPRLAMVKLLVGWFICLILTITGSQVRWGRLPVDVLPEEVNRLDRPRQLQLGGRAVSITAVRAVLVLVVLAVIWLLARPGGPLLLPLLPEALAPINLAVVGLVGFGLLGLLAYLAEPLRAGMGVLMFVAGLELYYGALEQTIAALALMAVVNLLVALIIAYLTQKRYAVATVLK